MTTAPILELHAPPEGGCVYLKLTLAADCAALRIIRRTDRAATSEVDLGIGENIDASVYLPDDYVPRSNMLFDGHPSKLRHTGVYRVLLDFGTREQPLRDGTTYFYAAFAADTAGAWSAAGSASITPRTKLSTTDIDPSVTVRQRLREKLHRLLQTGRYDFRPEVVAEGIEVYRAYPFKGEEKFPCFSVHLERDSESHAAIGRGGTQRSHPDKQSDHRVEYREFELAIIGWTMLDTERDSLRALVKAAIHEDKIFYELAGLGDFKIVGPSDAEEFTLGIAPFWNVVIEITGEYTLQPEISETTKIVTVETRTLTLVDSGVLNTATTTTLTDSTKAWNPARWAGGRFVVRMASGALVGQQRLILANTSTALTFEALPSAPTPGDAYQILRIEDPSRVEYQSIA